MITSYTLKTITINGEVLGQKLQAIGSTREAARAEMAKQVEQVYLSAGYAVPFEGLK